MHAPYTQPGYLRSVREREELRTAINALAARMRMLPTINRPTPLVK